jgi:predicted CXXCH cytochrome family protein
MQIPADFPLESGQVTCQTCHESADAARHAMAAKNHTPMLRRSAVGPELCAACHSIETASSAKSMHAMALGQAHMTRKPGGSFSRSLGWGQVDAESQNCLSCHDGMMASDASLGSGGTRGAHGKDHPVGVRYQNSTKSVGVMPLAPAVTLNSRIRLFDQTVGCGSCHSLYSPEEKHLVMSNLRSKLCLSCHQDR